MLRSARRPRRAPAFLAAALLALSLVSSVCVTPAHAQRRLTITFFDARYTVGRDGVLDVEERITVRFDGSWNGIYRWIPVRYELDDGRRHEIDLDVQSVEDGNGNSLRREIKRQGALVNVKTWVPQAQDTTHTIVYRYRVQNGLRYFDGDEQMEWAHDELFWNVTGDEWEMPILRAQAIVKLPDEARGIRAVAYTGPSGARGRDYEQEIRGSTVLFETTRRLESREGLTVVVGWEPGLVARPPATARLARLIKDYLFLPLPFIALFFMARLWSRKGRDPELNRSVMPQYDPPEGLSPAEVGTLMDFNVDPRDLSATIIDLAVRGYLRIEEVPSRFRKRPKDHIIHILKAWTEAAELKPFESSVLKALQKVADEEGEYSARSVKVSDLKQEFYRDVPEIKRGIYDRLTAPPKMFTARPDKLQGRWVATGLVVGGLCVGLAVLARKAYIGDPIVTWGAVILVPIVVIGFGLFMPARTLKGVWALHHILGLREYIDRVDRDRLKYVTLEHFEKLLPFAAALGLEKKWTQAFAAILTQPPNWYVSHHSGPFHANYFSNSLSRMTTQTGTALVTAPRSASGGSGFGGGGGSGGGFGGGGGGGF
ncbi:MAG: DUF2207 domain-containing protein [Gemmatimonadota bacterium]|nr:MAG: DUF2207 domain-containing protein [Gemmatimonadota bacterium]